MKIAPKIVAALAISFLVFTTKCSRIQSRPGSNQLSKEDVVLYQYLEQRPELNLFYKSTIPSVAISDVLNHYEAFLDTGDAPIIQRKKFSISELEIQGMKRKYLDHNWQEIKWNLPLAGRIHRKKDWRQVNNLLFISNILFH